MVSPALAHVLITLHMLSTGVVARVDHSQYGTLLPEWCGSCMQTHCVLALGLRSRCMSSAFVCLFYQA